MGLVIGLSLLGAVGLIALCAPALAGDQAQQFGPRGAGPSTDHWLGTDAAGHDVLLRSLIATRLTVVLTLCATVISVVVGVLFGTSVAMMRSRMREICLRAIDAVVAFPAVLLALVVASVLGAGAGSVVIAIGIAGIPYFARLSANLASGISRQSYVSTAQLLGVGRIRVVMRHVLPNMAEPLLVLCASAFASSLTAISAMSFVGLGVQSPHYDWGKLLQDALPSMLVGHPFEVVGPSLLIVITSLGAILTGDGLAGSANPGVKWHKRIEVRPASDLGTVTLEPHLVEVKDLVVHNGPTRLVNGVSFHIATGEILGVVGESGSGKTLTAMALARLLPDNLTSSAACLRVGDLDLRLAVDPKVMARTVSLVYQDPGTTFNPALRMATQLTAVLRRHKAMSAKAANHRIVDALERVHLTKPALRLRQYPHELSGGMRQRAAIATALATEPELIVADEPTTALDVTVQAEILRELKRINRDFGTAIIFISHDIAVVRALCDRALVMYQGEIVEELPASKMTAENAKHPYTKRLLAATPEMFVRSASHG